MQPNSIKLQKNTTLIIAGLVLLILVILFLAFFPKGSVTIISESGAEISATTVRGEKFKKIGTSKATFRTRKTPTTVFIMSSKDSRKTITSVTLNKFNRKKVELKLNTSTTATKVADGAVANVFLDGTYGQGIVPDQYTFTNFRTDKYEPLRREFVGIPYVKKVISYDANNFIYSSFKEGVGRFTNGQLTRDDNMGTTITGSNLDAGGEDGINSVNLIDISKTISKPLVLLSHRNIFTSNDMGTTLKSITGFDAIEGSGYGIFSTNDYIYRFSATEPAQSASESNDDKKQKQSSDSHTSSIIQYDYNGKVITTLNIEAESVRAIASRGTNSYILTPDRLVVGRGDGSTSSELYFGFARDLVSFKDRVLLLGDNGVWQVGDDGTTLYLLSEFKDSGVGLANSFSVTGNRLIFGTQAQPGKTADTKMFSIQLK